MLEIRRIRPEESVASHKISTIVFNGRHDFSKEERDDDARRDPADWTWAAFEDGKMQSSMVENQYLMRFDGHSVRMTGIGGVGTLPEARKGGLVRKIFEKMLPEAHEDGVVFSNLTPFSHAFYRMFGYELCCSRIELTAPMREFGGKLQGDFEQIFADGDTSALQEIHSAYIRDINHAIHRDYWPDNRAWLRYIDSDPYKDGVFIYVWRDEKAEPRAHIKYRHARENHENIMRIQEVMYKDKEALYGVLTLLGGLGAQYDKAVWQMPTFIDPTDFATHDMWDLKQHIVPRDMTRVVNAQRALELMRRPEGERAYVVEVAKDPIIPANEGRFLVEYGSEGSAVRKTNKAADIVCDLPVLAQLVTGYRTLDNALLTRKGGLEVRGNMDTLRKVFTLRPQHITEWF